MKVFYCLAAAMVCTLHAQQIPIRRSQQFTAVDARPVTANSPGQLKSVSGENLVRLDADVLLLSAERIREALFWELALPTSSPPGKIRLILYPARTPDDLIGLASAYSPRHWEYELAIPDQVTTQKLVRAVAGVVLLDFANRDQGPKSAEIPLWLVEGLTRQMFEVAGPDLVLGAVPLGSMRRTVRERQGLDYLKHAQSVLRSQPLLSYAELANPHAETIDSARLTVYQYSAQLFVYELLHTDQGTTKLINFLRALPTCWNWEAALLRAYAADFRTLLDVEKRWSVDVLAFTAADPSQVRSKVACLNRLDDLLVVTARLHLHPNALPERTSLTLEQAITELDFASQIPVLQQKIALLASLRIHATPELIPLIDSYERTLSTYLQKRALAARTPEKRMQVQYNAGLVAADAIHELELFDRQRKALQPEQSLSGNSLTSSSR